MARRSLVTALEDFVDLKLKLAKIPDEQEVRQPTPNARAAVEQHRRLVTEALEATRAELADWLGALRIAANSE